MTGPLTCAEADTLLPLVADGALDAQADPDLFAHLADCPRCQEALAAHDLLTLTLERAPAPVRPRILQWRMPAAIAAGLAAAFIAAAVAPTLATPAVPVVAIAAPVANQEPTAADAVVIDVDVAALPSPVPGRRVYLVRRGDQVTLVDPGATPAQSAPPDAAQATFHRY